MKKIVAIMLALVMSCGLVFTACDNEDAPPDPDSGTVTPENPTPPEDTPKEYAVAVTCSEGGTYSLSPLGPYHDGDEVTLTALPYSGYSVESVTLNGEKVSLTEDNSYTFTVSAETSIYVEYGKISTYTVDVTCGEGGSYSLSPNKSVYYAGDEVTLTVTHRRSYEFGDVTLNGSAVTLSEDGTYSFTIEGNVVIDIAFEEIVTHTLNVSCGSGGTYSLSASGPYSDGQEVTLTVYPNADMKIGSVTVNGEEITLIKNAYTFNITEDSQITISFEAKAEGEADTYDVFVTCGAEGSYTLSPEGPYTSGSEVLLTITPQDGCYVSSVTVDGEEVGLVNGKYTFTISDDTVIVIEFGESLFAAELTGKWSPLLSAGALGYEFTLKGKSVIFSETEDGAQEYPVSEAGSGSYTFTVIDEENEKTEFTFSFLGTVNGGKLLVLSHTENGETVEAYYLLEGVDYFTFEYSLVLVANWVPTVTYGYPVEITETGVFYAGSPAVVLSYNAETYEIVLLDGTLTYTKSNDRLKFTPSDPDSKVVEYYREIPAGPATIPFLAGSWKTLDESHSVTVDELGNFFYDGTQYEIRSNDSSGAMKSYYFTIPGSGRWDVDFYGRVVWVHQGYDEDKSFTMYSGEPFPVVVDCGEGGSYTISIEYDGEVSTEERAEGYPIGTQITITFTANEGYAIDYVYEDVNGEMSRYSSTHGMKTFTLVFTVQQNWYDYHQNGRRAQATFIPEEDV